MPIFVGAGTSSFMKGSDGIGFTRLTTTQRNALTAVQGQVIFNTTTGVLEYYDGSAWAKVSAVLAVLNSVSGNIIDGLGSNLTLSGEGFLSGNLVVNFLQSADSIDVNVTVTPSSDTAATVAVPASVYNNVTAGRVVTIKVTNSDGSTSGNINKTAVALPSGGTVNTYSGYRSHKFTSGGTFTNTFISSVDVLIVAGGGGGGSDNSGGGGAGGMLVQTGVPVSAQGYTITVGGGGNGSTDPGGDSGPYATNGSNSSAFGYTATGGGRGASSGGANASPGGSGGGGGQEAASANGGSGTSGQGSSGGNGANSAGGGGGGKGGSGQNGNVRGSERGGNGGNGAANNYETGSNQNYAAGGGGGNQNGQYDNQPSTMSIGGRTNNSGSSRSTQGTDGTGSGGGGCTHNAGVNPSGGDGGDGVVVIRYAI
mgnify:FL=1